MCTMPIETRVHTVMGTRSIETKARLMVTGGQQPSASGAVTVTEAMSQKYELPQNMHTTVKVCVSRRQFLKDFANTR